MATLSARLHEMCLLVGQLLCGLCLIPLGLRAAASEDRMLTFAEIPDKPVSLRSEVGDSGRLTWWLPGGADEYVLPISGGVLVEPGRPELMRWLQDGSPWSLSELPALGLRYGDQMLIAIVPWPHYAELVIGDRLGVRFSFPSGRHRATPCEIVLMRRGPEPLEVARGFRDWRRSAADLGAIPRPRLLQEKAADLAKVRRLMGAPHIYLWGPALFSRHDIPRNEWLKFAKALSRAPPAGVGGRMLDCFSAGQRRALEELANVEWPMDYLTIEVAGAIDEVLSERSLLMVDPEVPTAEVIERNRAAVAEAFSHFVNPAESWGDGLSKSLLGALHEAGIDRALLLLSDLYGRSWRPELAVHADHLGYLLGPYDSYHSVHSPTARPDDTWETAQFDIGAYERGRVMNADGSGHGGFRGRGYHFSPEAAWPYVQRRVNGLASRIPYSAWFIDCDATAECFDDFGPEHPATRIDDINVRRRRLAWLESEHRMVVGSEGGSVLFADVIHFGHGVHTPYIGHLDPSFGDRQSPHYLGRHWPPDTPEQSFKPVPVPPSLKGPYFDPAVRVPLYQAALGDEVIVTHHWSFDSLKLSNIERTRELLEILYMVPPMYHLNRETWPKRRERILRHVAFWGPLHRELAAAPLTRFEHLSEDRLVQRTTFQTRSGEVSIAVNFGREPQAGCPPYSATVAGSIAAQTLSYRASGSGAVSGGNLRRQSTE